MQLRTYTNLWNTEKRLYKIYDWTLPYAVSLRQLGLFFGSAIPWFFLVSKLSPFHGPSAGALYLIVPAAVTYFGDRPVAEGKTAPAWVASQVKFLFRPRVHVGLAAEKYEPGTETYLVGKAWTRNKSAASKSL